MKKQETAQRFLGYLAERYPVAECALHFTTPLELLVATILSAQCTDVRVNIVTADLFTKYTSVDDFADAPLEELMEDIKTVGLFRNKAKSIIAMAQVLRTSHNSTVPATLEELVNLPGVGRKTANVVLGNAFGIPGITVDTHLKRVSNRLGLVDSDDPVKIEFQLMELIPQPEWTEFSHRAILFGRDLCGAKKPECTPCKMQADCLYFNK